MKVRNWSSQHSIARGTSAKDLVKLIKTKGTVALSMPSGDLAIPHLHFILGGRGSIAHVLAASGQGRFVGPDRILAKYFRVNMGIGKHYTIVVLGTNYALTLLTSDGLPWSDLRLNYPLTPVNLNGPKFLINYILPFSELSNGLRGAESQLTDHILDYAGV